jgi:hypothetical protein
MFKEQTTMGCNYMFTDCSSGVHELFASFGVGPRSIVAQGSILPASPKTSHCIDARQRIVNIDDLQE